MSYYISNKSCDMCNKIEVGLVEMKVGKTKHHLCYSCITEFAFDIVEYASLNLRDEFIERGYTIDSDDECGYIIKKKKGGM